jgi:hypothetical protein
MTARRFDMITFDCYGTLIDWETGISEAFRDAAAADGVSLDPCSASQSHTIAQVCGSRSCHARTALAGTTRWGSWSAGESLRCPRSPENQAEGSPDALGSEEETERPNFMPNSGIVGPLRVIVERGSYKPDKPLRNVAAGQPTGPLLGS